MEYTNYYDKNRHKGNQPIRVLEERIFQWFKETYPEFEEEVNSEVNYNGLKGVIVKYGDNKITDIPEINENREIIFQETFLSYLWSLSYSLFVIFDEVVQKPLLQKQRPKTIETSNSIAKNANELLKYGLSLKEEFKNWDIINLPNPESVSNFDKDRIEKANGVYLNALRFIIAHEYTHHLFGHIDADKNALLQGQIIPNLKKQEDEFEADSYAITILKNGITNEKDKTNAGIGIIVAFSAFIFLEGNYLQDCKFLDKTHPDIDIRIEKCLNELNLDEINNLYGILSLTLKFWSVKYDIKIEWPQEVETYSELVKITFEQLKEKKYYS